MKILCKQRIYSEYITPGVEYSCVFFRDMVSYKRENGSGSYMRIADFDRYVKEKRIVILEGV